jgi:soluble lytic murein transglycosylase-like protein
MINEIVEKYAAQFAVPATWIHAVIQTESGGNPEAYRPEPQIDDASYGLMQLLYATARGLGYRDAPEGLFDPDTNIYWGVHLLAELRRQHGTDPRRIYSAYNSGRPDLYRTSTEVARNVERFIKNLEAEEQKPTAPNVAQSVGLGLIPAGLVLLGLAFWR